MSKIKIKNFGPIKEGYRDADGNEWMDIKKVTLFIGNQGSGKSVVAKLISTFAWIEKALTRGDYSVKEFERKDRLKRQIEYHRLENYFHNSKNTTIEYQGGSYYFSYKNGYLQINETKNGHYPLPQIMYVPAERNFISYLKATWGIKLTSYSLREFEEEFGNAMDNMTGQIKLPINDAYIEHNKQNKFLYLGGNDYKIRLSEASSGFQSFVPLYLVSQFLAKSVFSQSDSNHTQFMSIDQRERFRKRVQEIEAMIDITDEQRRIFNSEAAKLFNKTAFINIVEEPEQNLFPSSQWQMLKSLLEFNNKIPENKLIMTTHSPYLINYLTLAVKADGLKKRVNSEALKNKLYTIVPENSTTDPTKLVIYQCDEKDGTIKKLDKPNGLPSDENYLNNEIAESNELFAQLLEIQQAL